MPTAAKPLFRPEALRPKLSGFTMPPAAAAARNKLANWAKLLDTKQAERMKETELLGGFINDVFVDLLGYTGPAGGAAQYTLKREATVEVDGKFADAALGRFSIADDAPQYVAAVEGKGPRDPLDRPFAGRKMSAVDQALRYAVNLVCDWYLVTNLHEIRLYHKGHDQFTFERFEIAKLAEDADLKRFVFLLGAERLLAPGGNHLDALLTESKKIGRELTNDYYREYRALRESVFEALRKHNPDRRPAELLAATQKLLDRILFIAFAEDRDLLPRDSIAHAYEHEDEYNPRPVWDNFKVLFRWVDKGNAKRQITPYNGGLFKPDDYLESLTVPDAVCLGFKKLADYEYGNAADAESKLIDVEILGHIFEQSISDLEEMQNRLAGFVKETKAKEQKRTTRKEAGAFYTPAFITRHIVAETLGPVVAARFEQLRSAHEAAAVKALKKVFANPITFDPDRLTKPQTAALIAFWLAWLEELGRVRIVDPACGSGAFLIEAFDQMFAEYDKAQGVLNELRGATLFDIRKTILEHNLYGVDLNGEAVEIARLSCWIKTAEFGKELTSLDHNIRRGNSVIADPAVHSLAFDWQAAFPEVFAAGGFDVVIGNPPYVRQEWISAFKPYLQAHYRAYDGTADLYVYFYELGINLLKPGGRLCFIVTNKWMKAGYGEPLRRFFAESAWVESVVNFGHAKQIFEDADVFPSILVARKPTDEPPPPTARVCDIPREQLRIDDLSRQVKEQGFAMPRSQLGAETWTLEPPGVVALLEKMRRIGKPLKKWGAVIPLYGIKTGFREAFVLDAQTKAQLVTADPKSAELCKPYIQGQDINRWHSQWIGGWMLALKSSGNHTWPWSTAGEQAEAVFAATFPAVHAHLNQYRDALVKRSDQGEHWWELRACAYWDKFDRPKIIYPDLTWRPSFSFDNAGALVGDTTFFLPVADFWILAVLNSPIVWAWLWRKTIHGKDEVLRLKTIYTAQIPIPSPPDEIRSVAETAVGRLINLTVRQHGSRGAVLDWLRVEYGVEKPSQKLQDLSSLDANSMVAEVKKVRGKKQPLTVAGLKALKEEYARSVVPLQTLAAEARSLERQVADLVNAAYGLTPEEVGLLWKTAPPRMPGEAPGM